MQVRDDISIAELARLVSRYRRVTVRNFGTFYFGTLPEKRNYNPQTGEMMVLPERDKLFFRPSRRKKLKRAKV